MPCSIEWMPPRTAFLMPCVACACAMTVLPAARASYTIAAISSGAKPVAPGSSLGDITPPLVWTLIWSAPARRTSRAARRTPSTPSTTVCGISELVGRTFTPPGMVESPCPPVCDSAEADARSGEQPLIEGHLDPARRPGRVADAGEPGGERHPGVVERVGDRQAVR